MIRCLIVAAVLIAGFLNLSHAQKIEVTPETVLTDQVADVRVTGTRPGATVTIRAELVDGGGQGWVSEADFTADAQGVVDTATQAPVKSSYRIASAMGLIWSMMPIAKNVHVYEPPRQLGSQMIQFHLLQEGKELASTQLVQLAVADGVRQIRIEGRLHGILFLPPGEEKHPGVLVLGGSEGGLPGRRAAWLASRGFAAFALAYFHYEGLPENLQNIPLEYFGDALAWMMQRPEIDGGRIGVMGVSRGGELALQLGSMYPEIRAVVAYVPANVRHPACCARNLGAAWTWKGQPLAWALPERRPDPEAIMRATIWVEHTHGPILMIGGEDDGVWPSAEMVDTAAARLRQAHFAYPVTVLKYPHAGHRAGVPEIMPDWSNGVPHPVSGVMTSYGGTAEGNAASSLNAIPKVLAFLHDSLGGGEKPVAGGAAGGNAQP